MVACPEARHNASGCFEKVYRCAATGSVSAKHVYRRTCSRATAQVKGPSMAISTPVSPDAAMLTTISDLAAAGVLTLRVARTYPLDK